MESSAGLHGRSVLTLQEWTPNEIKQVLTTAAWLKANPKVAQIRYALAGQSVALLFELPSTRTRVSFQVAVESLGAAPVVLGWEDSQLGRGEPIKDTARVLSRYVDGIVIRCRRHETLQEFSRWASVPVFNALTDRIHPFQALADALTLWEHKRHLAGLKLAYVGDGNNMAHSYVVVGAKLGMHVVVASPAAYAPDPTLVQWAEKEALLTGGSVQVVEDPREAVAGADAVATDVFVSMGQVDQEAKRLSLGPYQVNADLMTRAKPDALFLHCLPAHRGEEVTEEVLEGPQSAVFDQAENRLWVQKAALLHSLGE
ncbi:MAG: ornithine carbamoyltransferase [Firmicutes bacterium]|nr:ornithine carbamoyltransferase [Alicyclobacillaceae bacterium]MCL6497845.1 ornithine carbamoyltransferase [Bacillota bacterium]